MAVSAAVMKAVLWFTHQKIQNIPSNELSFPQQNKDPSCHSECRVPCLGPAYSAVVWCGHDNAITGINVSVQKQPNCCCLAAITIRPGLECLTHPLFLLLFETRIQRNHFSVLTPLVSKHAFVSLPNVDELHSSIDRASTHFLQFQKTLIFFFSS